VREERSFGSYRAFYLVPRWLRSFWRKPPVD